MCNSIGVLFGIFLGEVCFTLLVSEEFNTKYFRSTPGTGGLISMKSKYCGQLKLILFSLIKCINYHLHHLNKCFISFFQAFCYFGLF